MILAHLYVYNVYTAKYNTPECNATVSHLYDESHIVVIARHLFRTLDLSEPQKIEKIWCCPTWICKLECGTLFSIPLDWTSIVVGCHPCLMPRQKCVKASVDGHTCRW